MQLCFKEDKGFEALIEAAARLNGLGVAPRYPLLHARLTRRDAHEAVLAAERIAGFVRERLTT